MRNEILYTENFLDSFLLAKEYIENELSSPLAAQNFVDSVFEKIENTSATPTIAVKRFTLEGVPCFVISYKKWNIYYSVEDNTMKILDIIHQSQRSSF